MTRVFENQFFEAFCERGDHRIQHAVGPKPKALSVYERFDDVEFRRCSFQGSSISVTRDPQKRSTFRNIRLIDCDVRGCSIDTAVLEDIYVERLKTHNMLCCWGAAFKHVKLKGPVGKIMFNCAVSTGMATPDEQRAFDEANAAYYASVDWALDISEAEFEEGDIRGIPSRLIRRDSESQAVVTREKALKGQWQTLDLSKTWYAHSMNLLLTNLSNHPDIVLVAPKRHRKYRDLLEGIRLLREAGVAEPD